MALRVGHLSTFYHTAPLLMGRADIDEQIGQPVHWRLFGTGPAIMESFGKGELDLAYIGLPPAIIGISKGTEALCVASGHEEGTVIVGLRSLHTASMLGEAMQGFRGMTIGVPGKGSIHDVILRHAIKSLDLEGSITVINYRWADEIVDALKQHQVQGGFGTPALAVAASRYAGGHMILGPQMIWPHNPSYGILASKRMIREAPEPLGRFLQLHEEASEMLRTHTEEAAEAIAKVVGVVEADYILETLSISPNYCAKLTENYINSTMKFVRSMRELGYIARDVAREEIFHLDIIDRIHPGPSHVGLSRRT